MFPTFTSIKRSFKVAMSIQSFKLHSTPDLAEDAGTKAFRLEQQYLATALTFIYLVKQIVTNHMRVSHHSYDEIFENENGGVFSSLKFLIFFNKDLRKRTRYVDASHKITTSTLKKEKR
jgi:hypothetical protein